MLWCYGYTDHSDQLLQLSEGQLLQQLLTVFRNGYHVNNLERNEKIQALWQCAQKTGLDCESSYHKQLKFDISSLLAYS